MTETFTSILDAAMASALASAEARGYQRGRDDAARDALGEPSRASVDLAGRIRLATALRDIMGQVDDMTLDDGDILVDMEVEAPDAIEVPADDCGLSEIAEWLGEHGGKTLIDQGDAEVDCSVASRALADQAANLRRVRDALCALIDRL